MDVPALPVAPVPPGTGSLTETPLDPERAAQIREAAVHFESVFLAEMLSQTGFGAAREEFGGGPGEDAFASLLVREQADLLAEKGGVGLAEHIFKALVRAEAAR